MAHLVHFFIENKRAPLMKLEPVNIGRQNLKGEANKPNLSIFKEIDGRQI